MFYSSTRGQDNNVSFFNVLLNGLSTDGGLYVPNKLPKIKNEDLIKFKHLSYSELAFEITKDFVISDEISKNDYWYIVKKTYGKEFGKDIISMENLNDKEYILNLFHGPTFAFKDYALQLLGNLYDFILKKKKINITILGATSGDTGSAAIYGCSKSERANVFILFPKGKVSEIQRKQMTTYDRNNVTNIEVEGNFDDCQKLVKDFFKLNNRVKKYNLAAINSINWVRILGQLVYYFWSYLKVENKFNPIKYPSLEAQIAALSDDIAYNNHDIQDGMRAKLFTLNDLKEINFFKNIIESHKKNIKRKNKEILIYQVIRDSINIMVQDLINTTIKNINYFKIKNCNDVHNSKKNLVSFSNKLINIEKDIKQFLKSKMYNNKYVLFKNNKGKFIIKKLFKEISKNPKKYLYKEQLKKGKYRAIADYISGMTDRYAINLYNYIK